MRHRMRKKRDTSSRREITEKTEANLCEMDTREKSLTETVSDIDTVRKTIENLNFNAGTTEANEQVEQHIKGAEVETVTEFNQENELLDQAHDVSQEIKRDLTDHSDSSESNLNEISDTGKQIDIQRAVDKLEMARKEVLQDLDFLKDQIEQTTRAKEKSDIAQKKLQERVNSNS